MKKVFKILLLSLVIFSLQVKPAECQIKKVNPVADPKITAFYIDNSNKSKYIIINKSGKDIKRHVLYRHQMRKVLFNYIQLHYKDANDVKYINKIVDAYLKLLYRIPADRQTVLYYIALCSVESNFNMESRSHCGAIGISQVMWGVWGNIIQENYDISRTQLVRSPFANIYVGYKIWHNYLRKHNYNIRDANYGYLGDNCSQYNHKITKRHSLLVKMIYDEIKRGA
jgi:hypothetical protein